ncbi:MAG: rhomboid family intramembrane serine protease [Opitutaceae bacterium]
MTRITPLFQKRLPRTYFYATLGVIALNLLVFLLTEIDRTMLGLLAMNPLAVVTEGAWWQVFTYMYAHGDVSHILFNMLGLFFFGTAAEEELGSWEFLAFYHVTGVLAGLASLGIYWLTGQYEVYLLGASGAVFAVTLAFAAYRPHARVLVFFVIPLRARSLVILYAAFEVFSQVFNPYGGIAHLTHLAGFLFAFLYLLLRLRVNAWTRFWAS